MTVTGRVLATAALVSACSGQPVSERPARSSGAALPSPSASVPRTANTAAPLAAKKDPVIDEALALVSQVRELAVKRPVPGMRLDRAALRAEVDRMLREETPPEALRANGEILYALDTVRADFDLERATSMLYGAELAGFYDPKSGRMILATDLGRDNERITLYHELVHALQDQHFDLATAFDFADDESDVQGALHAVAEGDATSAMVDVLAAARGAKAPELSASAFQLESLMVQASPDLREVPGILTRAMVAPYADGVAFVQFMRKHAGGWSGVDRAFRQRPASTEQILHPEKYLAGEAPEVAPIPEAPPGFAASFFHDVMGEQGLRILFEDWAPARDAALAASDWSGDRLALFENGADHELLWHLVFDSEAAAQRGAAVLARGALRAELDDTASSGDPRLRPFAPERDASNAIAHGSFCRSRKQRGEFAMVRHGRHIGVAVGPYRRGVATVRQRDACTQAIRLAARIAEQR